MSNEVRDWVEMPKKVVLFNPEKKIKGGGSPIVNYPISEMLVDENGNPSMGRDGVERYTGESKEWSLDCGEKKRFPKYVAKVLVDRYGFLQILIEDKKTEDSKEKVPGEVECKFCGYSFGSEKILGTHIGEKHPEEIIGTTT